MPPRSDFIQDAQQALGGPGRHVLFFGGIPHELDLSHLPPFQEPFLDEATASLIWEGGVETFQGLFPQGGAPLWRMVIPFTVAYVGLSRVGTIPGDQERMLPIRLPGEDPCWPDVLGERQIWEDVLLVSKIDTVALDDDGLRGEYERFGNIRAMASLEVCQEGGLAILMDHLGEATRFAWDQIGRQHALKPEPAIFEGNFAHELAPQSAQWALDLGAAGPPEGFRGAFVGGINNGTLRLGEAFGDADFRGLWVAAGGLGGTIEAGDPSGLFLLGPQQAVLVHPVSGGMELLVTLWVRDPKARITPALAWTEHLTQLIEQKAPAPFGQF